ncbi:MAG: hypothetical protein M1122_00650 [Candidatus Marsarchaeota archaeon]|jgi:hypothetical protein|nr:hypothetical protein [Candidatus Marsarchaeota archaeon]
MEKTNGLLGRYPYRGAASQRAVDFQVRLYEIRQQNAIRELKRSEVKEEAKRLGIQEILRK